MFVAPTVPLNPAWKIYCPAVSFSFLIAAKVVLLNTKTPFLPYSDLIPCIKVNRPSAVNALALPSHDHQHMI